MADDVPVELANLSKELQCPIWYGTVIKQSSPVGLP
jgi:hypothetical protein